MALKYELFDHAERDRFIGFARNLNQTQQKYDKELLFNAYVHWHSYAMHLKKIEQEAEQKRKVIEILKTSNRGSRSTMEKELLRRYISSHLTCIPKSISMSEMDQLCNELDWYPYIGRSILFLQGDFGNVYYMIASGRAGLYLEPSKDREMVIAREFGHLRGQPFTGTDEDLQRLGNNIFNLSSGAGFGEYAILASTNKIRSCAVVALDPDSMLLIMHAETYNAVLRQHHYRQKQLSSATALLTELPLFKHHNYSKIASIAYTMRSQTYSNQSSIVKAGDPVINVMLVASGQVKVYAPQGEAVGNTINPSDPTTATSSTTTNPFMKIIEKRMPKLAVSLLGRGQIIGEIEMHRGFRHFQMSYEASGSSTEILEIPATVFKENVHNEEFKASILYKNMEGMTEFKEQKRVHRLSRAYDAMKKMMEGTTEEDKMKEELMTVLPSILDSDVKSSRHSMLASNSRRNSALTTTTTKPSMLGSLGSMSGSGKYPNPGHTTGMPAGLASMIATAKHTAPGNTNTVSGTVSGTVSMTSSTPVKAHSVSFTTPTGPVVPAAIPLGGSATRPQQINTNFMMNHTPSTPSNTASSQQQPTSPRKSSVVSQSPRKLSFMPVTASKG